ncbi:MAG: ribonuclease R [Candidatus Firestonebacteria bacterium RIFOXYC2_FULL_39_67]|nr:MAG: ribonuclease R [Candidatus Firestonebacteria bacterium RIFOXYD2_FULL_39_29]OGF52465.1 MAG: ribonuclease R [Candidatus Firestonebacteria bacterium RifOxyC12_full_39_7]OGF55742.1 MAG: ribonuclease R [Candidatus Firestonebacteria bacterium RIFOXYC2_FULL_39_67]
MITKETFLKYLASGRKGPAPFREIMKQFNISKKDKKRLDRFLSELIADGTIVRVAHDKFGLAEAMDLKVGVLSGHRNGFGFVIIPDAEQDIFIPPPMMNGAMHNDKVVVRVTGSKDGGKKKEGEIIRVLERANNEIVGVYEESKHFGFVVPDDKKVWHNIYIHKNDSKGAKGGQKVVVKVTEWPDKGQNPEGRITEILGFKLDPEVDFKAIIRQYNIRTEFTPEVIAEAKASAQPIPEEEIWKRKDFRDDIVFTIDGEDAKDFDDAVSLTEKNGEYHLGVHIADVSYYVKPGSALDSEGYERGNSIYFPNHVIPMLPEALSNEMCSLKPDVDRLTMSAVMKLDAKGELKGYELVKSIIRSKRRMTYTKVSKIVEDKDKELRAEYSDIASTLDNMLKLAKILNKKRFNDGSIDFDLPETKIILDSHDAPLRVEKIIRNWAHRLIEEFMLLTNEVVATHIFRQGLASIYRVHDIPDYDDLIEFERFVNSLKYPLKLKEDVDPKLIQALLKRVKGTPEEEVINNLALRSMKLAVYSTEARGHFALAKKYYSHFTSPIRRYPDLAVHRVLKVLLEKDNRNKYPQSELIKTAKHCSDTERVAEEVEEEIVKLKKIQLIKNHVGRVLDGVVTGVQSYGIFVELSVLYIEGLVHVSSMADDYYTFDEKQYAMFGRNNKKRYRLGDKVKVKVERVDVDKRQVDFVLAK